jgi:DNA-binding SARP family transcriptional activator
MEFRILGSFEVLGSGGIIELRGTKRRGLVAFLVTHAGQPISRDRLVEDLWGHRGSDGAGRTVQTYVSQLRKVLQDKGVTLETRPGGYVLDFDIGQLDASRFEQDVTAAGAELDLPRRLELLDGALALWRGAPLAEFAGADWADREARRLESLHLQALQRQCDTLLALDRAGEAAAQLEDLVGIYPLDERFWAQFMLALYRSGRQADALGAYQEARRRLVEELGIEPGPELVDLEHRILDHDPSLLTPKDRRAAGDESGASTSAGRDRWHPRTFLLTDIVDSVALWERDPESMADAVARHDAIIEGSVREERGELVRKKGEGDSTFSVFPRPTDAVAAAVTVQRVLAGERWPTERLRVRIGVHTGDGEPRQGDWYGPAVNRAGRLRSMAEGGQTLVSGVTAGLVADALPDGVSLLYRGRRALRGIERPEEVWELVAGDDPRLAVAPTEALDAGEIHGARGREGTAVPTALPFVGRDDLLGGLRAAWNRCDDAPERVLVTGAAGIGKTALVSHFVREVQREGAKVLWGVCEPEMMLPFQPWVEAIRPVAAAVAHRLGPLAGDLALALPLPGIDSLPPRVGDDTLRHRICEALLAVLEAVSDGERLCVVIDDFHWADPLTVTMVRFVARHGAGLPILLVVVGRDGDSVDSIGGRGVSSDHVEVGSLNPREIASLVKAWLPATKLSNDSLDKLVHATGGNPFFVIELARAARSGPVEKPSSDAGLFEIVPGSIQAVLAQRIRGLPRECRTLLMVASVLGEEVAIDDLAQLTGRPPLSVLEDLQSGVDAAVLQETSVLGRFRFEHDLIRRHLFGDMTSSRRARLHLEAAELRRGANDPEAIVDRAGHLVAAGRLVDIPVLVEAVLAAGAVLQITGGFEQARDLYDYAIDAAEGTENDASIARLLAALGTILAALDRPYEAQQTLDRAASLARTLDTPAVTVETALALSVFDPQVVPALDKIHVLRHAVSLLREEDSMERVRALNQLGLIESFLGNQTVAQSLLDEAGQSAERVGTALARVHVSHARHVHGRAHGEPVATTVARTHKAIAIATAARDRQAEALARGELVTSCLEAGDLELARVALDDYSALVGRTRDPMGRWIAATGQAMLAQAAGDLDLADRLAAEALDLGTRLDIGVAGVGFGAHLFVSSWLRGTLGMIVPQVEAFAEAYKDLPIWSMALALARVGAGDTPGARSALERVGPLDKLVDDVLRPGTLVLAGDVLFALGHRADAALLRDLLTPFRDRFVVVATAFALVGPVRRSLGLLESLAGSQRNAAELLRSTARLCRSRGMIAWADRCIQDASVVADQGRIASQLASGNVRVETGKGAGHAPM